MGYRDPIRDASAEARRDLLDAAIVLGAHLDAPEGEVDDEMLVRALSVFMDARAGYLASLAARYGIGSDTGPPSTHPRHGAPESMRRFGLTG
jgi:hypothetical protein